MILDQLADTELSAIHKEWIVAFDRLLEAWRTGFINDEQFERCKDDLRNRKAELSERARCQP